MKATITTYDNNGEKIVSRNYNFIDATREHYANALESIIEDSERYLEEQAVDYKEELTEE